MALSQASRAQTNLALNKPVIFSREHSTHLGVYAVDGDMTTRWHCGGDMPDGKRQAWFAVDLESPVTVNKVTIKWEWAFARTFDIDVSTDGSSWQTVRTVEWNTCFQDGDGGVNELYFEPVNARYVRMYGLATATPYRYSFWEFEVYANAPVPPNPPDYRYPDFTKPFKIDGALHPAEIYNVGPVMYGPWNFHTNTRLITGVDGWDTLSFPGGNKIAWDFSWKMAPYPFHINCMGGINYGSRTAGIHGGNPVAPGDSGILPLNAVESDIFTTWKCTYDGENSWDVAYDMWTSSAADSCHGCPKDNPVGCDEVMIFLHTAGNYTLNGAKGGYKGEPMDTVTIAGIKWGYWSNERTKQFEPLGESVTDFNANLKDFFTFVNNRGDLNAEWLHRMYVGTEVGSEVGSGWVKTTEWTLTSPDAPSSTWNPRPVASACPPSAAPRAKAHLLANPGGASSGQPLASGAELYTIRGECIGKRLPRSSTAGMYIVR